MRFPNNLGALSQPVAESPVALPSFGRVSLLESVNHHGRPSWYIPIARNRVPVKPRPLLAPAMVRERMKWPLLDACIYLMGL